MNSGENLRFAIVVQAIKDYKKALRKGDEYKIISLEHWFLGEWGQYLSGGNGAYIIDKVRKEIQSNDGKQNKRRKLLSNLWFYD